MRESHQMIQIKNRKICHYNRPPFIIAEIGSNFRSLDDCIKAVKIAASVGADAVKFQLFDDKSLYGEDTLQESTGSIRKGWLFTLQDIAVKCDIELMCSAFSPELYQHINSFVNIHKVASAEALHPRILEQINKFQKPVFISTGGKFIHDLDRINSVISVPLIFLYCVSNYPAKNINLENIKYLRDHCHHLVGYSDHTIGIKTAIGAAKVACVIEKHLNPFGYSDTPDAPHSIGAEDFRLMISEIRGQTGVCEEEMHCKHNRRVIAIDDIKQGQILREGINIGIYRSKVYTPYLSPMLINSMIGQIAKRDIKKGQAITQLDYE